MKRFIQDHKAIILMVFCTLFTSTGQILWKLGINQIDFTKIHSFLNVYFISGFVIYAVGAILMLLAFAQGELSILYPIIATSYVWVSLVSPLLFPHDAMNVWKWLGVMVILISVSLMGWGGKRNG